MPPGAYFKTYNKYIYKILETVYNIIIITNNLKSKEEIKCSD